MTGDWSPISLTPVTDEFPQAELPYLIVAPFIGALPLSLEFSKIPYVITGVCFVLLLFLIAKKLFGKNEALIVGLAAAINPWSLFFSRTAYEAPLAIFFYLFSFYLLLIAKGRYILAIFIPMFIGFYSYMGTKLLFLPFIMISIFYSWYYINKKK